MSAAVGERPPRSRTLRAGLPASLVVLSPLLGFVLLIAIWWLVAAIGFQGRGFLLPDPPAVWRAIGGNGSVLAHAVWQTFISAALGLLVSVVIGVLVAALLSTSRLLGDAFYPSAVVFQTVPIIAAAPVLVLWFKYGRTSLVAVVVLITFFPILSNTLAGLRSIDRNQAELFALYRASRWRLLFKLRFPNALPSFFAGLRISAGLAVTGANVGEFLIGTGGSKAGLGTLIISSASQLRTDLLFGVAGCSVALSVAFFLLIDRASRVLARRFVSI
jgi:NitT/TauT family transport system permease protein